MHSTSARKGLTQQTKAIHTCHGAFLLLTSEPLSYSSTGTNSKSWTTPHQETEYWADHSASYDMDVERDSSSRQRQATSSDNGRTVQANTAKSMKEIVGIGLSLCESS